MIAARADSELMHDVEQFLFREARLADEHDAPAALVRVDDEHVDASVGVRLRRERNGTW